MSNIVGIMWNKNEGDILEEIIRKAVLKVDSLLITDDGSTDNSWEIITRLKKELPDKIEWVQQKPSKDDPAQRQALLDAVRARYDYRDTWIQVIESDLIITDTDIRTALAKYSHQDAQMNWFMFNAVRPQGWTGADNYPNWDKPITEILTHAHYWEQGPWSYRPFPLLEFDRDLWRPWPRGFTNYLDLSRDGRKEFYDIVADEDLPMLGHFGYRGPTHTHTKWAAHGKTRHPKFKDWDLTSPETTERTLPYYNGTYGSKSFTFNRQALIAHNQRSVK